MSSDDDSDVTKKTVIDPYQGITIDRRYHIEYLLAQGGYGAVYRGRHVINDREVAIKVLQPELMGDQGVVARFRREARALGALKSPHTVTALDYGETADGTLYIVMELLKGESLYERLHSRGPMPWRQIATITREVCVSLEEAHGLGIVHRDLKPGNIHLERRGPRYDYVKVLDFGIAKILHGAVADTAGITHAGQVIGTFDYMSPEQLVGGAIDHRSDIFALGVMMYETITGERPFGTSPTTSAMISAILAGPPPAISSRVPAPIALDAIVQRCLEWEPPHRYPDVRALSADLEGVLTLADESTEPVGRMESFTSDEATWNDESPTLRPEPVSSPNGLYTPLPPSGPPIEPRRPSAALPPGGKPPSSKPRR